MKLQMDQSQKNSVDIARLEGKVDVIAERLTQMKDNHLFHIEKDMRQLRALVWFIGTTVFAQMLFLIIRSFT
jgi:hypothetical protein